MDSAAGPERPELTAATSGFVLAAAIAVLLNTTLACAKDAYAPLKGFMKSLTGHDWTTQGLVDLLLFVGLGFFFMRTRVAEKIDPNRLIAVLVGAVGIAALGLALWYALF
jgi:hypothetical protein